MIKVTFTLDDETVEAIRGLARRRNKPQSAALGKLNRDDFADVPGLRLF